MDQLIDFFLMMLALSGSAIVVLSTILSKKEKTKEAKLLSIAFFSIAVITALIVFVPVYENREIEEKLRWPMITYSFMIAGFYINLFRTLTKK